MLMLGASVSLSKASPVGRSSQLHAGSEAILLYEDSTVELQEKKDSFGLFAHQIVSTIIFLRQNGDIKSIHISTHTEPCHLFSRPPPLLTQ